MFSPAFAAMSLRCDSVLATLFVIAVPARMNLKIQRKMFN